MVTIDTRLTYLDPFGIEDLTLPNVLRLTERLGVGVARKSLVVRQTGKSGGKSSQEGDEAGGMHFA